LAHCFNPLLSRSPEGDPEYSGRGQRVSINQFLFLMGGAGKGGHVESRGMPSVMAGILVLEPGHVCVPQTTKGQE